MKTKKSQEFHASKIKPLVQVVARMVQQNPDMANNMDYLWANVVREIPELKDRSHCANCGESMAIYLYTVTYLDTRLLCAMADVITKRMNKGMDFTAANKIHLPTEIKNYTLISRQTITSKLGLIAKVMKDGKHDRKAGWSITRRGFDFLRGQPIPKMVKVFHNRIQEHFEDTVTMKELISTPGNHKESEDLSAIAGVFIDTYQKPRLL